jgi:hypothetical protein
MSLRNTLALGLAGLAVMAPVDMRAQGPNPNQPYIQSFTYGGSGCPQGSTASSFENDRTRATLIFDHYVASSGDGIPVTEHNRGCQLNINVRVPNGSGAYCASLAYRGYVQLPSGAFATASASYNDYELPDGQVITGVGNGEAFTGPVSRDYVRKDLVSLEWNGTDPVITPLTVRSEIAVGSLNSLQAQITTDSIDILLEPGACEIPDTMPPTISVATPVAGGLYGLNATVPASFTCADEGSGVDSCVGPATLDTSTVGAHSFVVTATDLAGNVGETTVNYFVGGKNECKTGGHSKFLAPTFKNQGQCVSSFVK